MTKQSSKLDFGVGHSRPVDVISQHFLLNELSGSSTWLSQKKNYSRVLKAVGVHPSVQIPDKSEMLVREHLTKITSQCTPLEPTRPSVLVPLRMWAVLKTSSSNGSSKASCVRPYLFFIIS